MKIYVVDNGGQWTHREWKVLRELDVDTKIIPNTTPVEQIDADGLVLSGGAPRIGTESIKLGSIGDYIDCGRFAILGICVGHQFMALYFGGETAVSTVPEYGKVTVQIDAESKILKGIPKTFIAWESHNDEVRKLPDGFSAVAHSENCRIQAMEHGKKPLFGVQFHPEVDNTEHGEDIFKNFIGQCRK
jgi:GMP synthase (glutamine-hydrolysing)